VAYGNYIAAVDWLDVIRLRGGLQQTLKPLKVSFITQLTSLWVKEQPLGGCLAQILNDGEDLSASFWHPFQTPKVHPPKEAVSLEVRLKTAWDLLTPEAKSAHGFQRDILEILDILKATVENEAAFLSVLEPPADEERAKRVACPFEEPDKLPIEWGNLSKFWSI
jgi:hypothetical protein